MVWWGGERIKEISARKTNRERRNVGVFLEFSTFFLWLGGYIPTYPLIYASEGVSRECYLIAIQCPTDDCIHDGTNVLALNEDGYFNGGNCSPYRVQRQAANIRERKRMLRSESRTRNNTDKPPIKM